MLRILLGLFLSQAQSPVGRVVDLIRTLKDNIEADGKAEQKVHDDFSCWCKDTKQAKTADIDRATERVDALNREIESQEGSRGTYEATITQLEKDIASNIDSRKRSKALREKENETYSKERLETEQCINALEHATKVLQGSGDKMDASTLEVETLSIVAGVRSALHKLPKENLLSKDDVSTLSRFVDDQGWERSGFLQVLRNPFGAYAPQSSKIQGILKNMYDTFVAQMESANGEEATAKRRYDDLMQSKEEDFDTLTENLLRKKQDLGDNSNSLAENKLERADTRKQVRDDKLFLQNTKDTCSQHAREWAERSRLRTEELGGISRALEILSSPEAQKTFDGSAAFVQLTAPHQSAAYSELQAPHSLRLAKLAARVKASTNGHFDAVFVAIDKMISVIREEDKSDIDSKDACEREAATLRSRGSDVKHQMDQETMQKQRIEDKIANLLAEKNKTIADKKNTEEEMQNALDARLEETSEFKKALSDDQKAVALLGQAIDMMKGVYGNAAMLLESSAVSKGPSTSPGNGTQATPSQDSNSAPQGFTKSYSGRSSESGGIVSVLTMIKEDVENEIKGSIQAEDLAREEYDKGQRVSVNSVRALKTKLANLEMTLAALTQRQSQSDSQLLMLEDTDGVHAETWSAHCQYCGWIYSMATKPANCQDAAFGEVSSFMTRKDKRKSELDGLRHAKMTLAGAEM